jgi:hypothetical protein
MDNNQIIILVLIVIGFLMYVQYRTSEALGNTTTTKPAFTTTAVPIKQTTTAIPVIITPTTRPPTTQPLTTSNVVPPPPPPAVAFPGNAGNTDAASCKNPAVNIDKIIAGSNQLSAEDLLPKYDSASDFAKENPVDKLLKEQNFLVSGYHMGINTVMQSNKIAYHDLRSAPQVPKQAIGPWGQSSYEEGAGFNRRHFELGA